MNASRRVVHLRARAGAALAAASVAVALAGCSATNPQQTSTPYDAGDGRSAQIGGVDANSGVKLLNFLIVSAAQGQPGRVVGALYNQTGDTQQVQLTVVQAGADGQAQSVGQTTVPVQAGEFVQLGSPSAATSTSTSTLADAAASSPGAEPAAGRAASFDIAQMPVAPGAVLQLFARTAATGGTSLDIPVLPAVGEYAPLAPTAAPSAQPSTVTPTGSLQPSANPSGAARQSPSGVASPSGEASPSASRSSGATSGASAEPSAS